MPSYVIEAPPVADDEEIDGFNPVIIAEATKSLRRLSVSEAVMELDLTGAPVVVFVHGTSGRVNLIYRRADGNIGWVDPPAVNADNPTFGIDAMKSAPYGPPPLRLGGLARSALGARRPCPHIANLTVPTLHSRYAK